jgi:hypothetical protein
VAAQAKPPISFSAAIQDFRTTRIEEVICYRFDQFDTAAQLLLKLASVACANNEVFSLQLLNFMIKEDSVIMSAFACLHSPSTADGEDDLHGSGGVSRDGDGQPEEDTIGFESERSEKLDSIGSGRRWRPMPHFILPYFVQSLMSCRGVWCYTWYRKCFGGDPQQPSKQQRVHQDCQQAAGVYLR